MLSGPQQVADWMERRGVNQREAARFFGLHFTVLNKILTGHRRPSFQTALVFEDRAGIPVRAWMPTAGGKRKNPASPKGQSRANWQGGNHHAR